MFNFSGLSNKSGFGKMLRLPLRYLPPGMVIPILQGKLKGKKWVVGSGNHGYWLGSYEYEKQMLFVKTISEGSVVYDIGTHVGFYTLLASVLVGRKGKVIAFEPCPRNLGYLKRHLRLNRCSNVRLFEAAVGEKEGVALFEESENSSMGKMGSKGNLEVQVLSLDALAHSKGIPPADYIKIDVEGAELQVLRGARDMLRKCHPVLFLATHGEQVHRECCDYLEKLGYQLDFVEKDEIVARQSI